MPRVPVIDLSSCFNKIEFDAKNHKYYVNNKNLISCTTYIGKLKTDIFNTAMKENYCKKYGFDIDYVTELWRLKAELGCLRGTEFHFLVESYYKYGIMNDPSILIEKEYKQFQDFLNDHKNLSPIKIEWVIYDVDMEIAGTVDMLFLNTDTGKYELYDWKTNKELKLKNSTKFKYPLEYMPQSDINIYSMQLSIYKAIIEKNTEIKIDKLAIVHFNKSDDGYNEYELSYKESELKQLGLI